MKKQETNLDLKAIAEGIEKSNDVGTMFFSIVNQKYSKNIASALCSGIRAYAKEDELLSIFESVNAENFNDLVIKSCNKILLILDKLLNKMHNEIIKELN